MPQVDTDYNKSARAFDDTFRRQDNITQLRPVADQSFSPKSRSSADGDTEQRVREYRSQAPSPPSRTQSVSGSEDEDRPREGRARSLKETRTPSRSPSLKDTTTVSSSADTSPIRRGRKPRRE